MNILNLKNVFTLLIVTILFIQCDPDTMVENEDKEGEYTIEMTDAPIDNHNIKATMVTFTAVELDGKRFDLESDVTVDIMSYQNGETFTLWKEKVEAKTYSEVKLILNNSQDAQGNAPGCYIEKNDGSKDNLAVDGSSESVIAVKKTENPKIKENEEMNSVIDFDLRKAIMVSDDSEDDFMFSSNMNAALRLVNKENSSKINGNVSDNLNMGGDKIVAYAYVKGTFDRDQEASGDENSFFANAVTSATVNSDGSYQLSYLEQGEYELIFIGYDRDDQTGKTEAKSILSSSLDITGSILGIELNTSASATLDITVLAALPL